MSKRAEEAALKSYPDYWKCYPFETNKEARAAFIKGYEQAEKDLADAAAFSSGPDGFYYGKGYQQGKKDAGKDIISLIESRISEILGDAQPNPVLRMELQGIIDKIK